MSERARRVFLAVPFRVPLKGSRGVTWELFCSDQVLKRSVTFCCETSVELQ